MLTKGTVYLLSALIAYAGWQWRKHDARKRLREMDEGTRCVGCEKCETEVRDGVVRCLLCGHTEVLANVRAVQLSEGELDAMTHRERRD
jgi:hypothetical protein